MMLLHDKDESIATIRARLKSKEWWMIVGSSPLGQELADGITECRREVINPHDKITIDYSDPAAAQVAVLIVGEGRYGIDNGDTADGLPVFLFGGHDDWCKRVHAKTCSQLFSTVEKPRIVAALRSIRIEHERSSISDPVRIAHDYADQLGRAG